MCLCGFTWCHWIHLDSIIRQLLSVLATCCQGIPDQCSFMYDSYSSWPWCHVRLSSSMTTRSRWLHQCWGLVPGPWSFIHRWVRSVRRSFSTKLSMDDKFWTYLQNWELRAQAADLECSCPELRRAYSFNRWFICQISLIQTLTIWNGFGVNGIIPPQLISRLDPGSVMFFPSWRFLFLMTAPLFF